MTSQLIVTVSSTPFLLFHSYLVEAALAMVLSGTYIPLPIAYPARMEIVTTFGAELLHASLNGIHHAIQSDMDLSLIPSFHLVLALLPLGALVQSGKLHPGNEDVIGRRDILDRYRRALGKAHPKLKLIIEDLDNMSPPHDYTTYVEKSDAPDTHAPGAYAEWDLGFDQLFDLDSLWPMLGDWPVQHAGQP